MIRAGKERETASLSFPSSAQPLSKRDAHVVARGGEERQPLFLFSLPPISYPIKDPCPLALLKAFIFNGKCVMLVGFFSLFRFLFLVITIVFHFMGLH